MNSVYNETSDNDGQNAGCHCKQLHNRIRNDNLFHCLPQICCSANSYFRTRKSIPISSALVDTYSRRGSSKCRCAGISARQAFDLRAPHVSDSWQRPVLDGSCAAASRHERQSQVASKDPLPALRHRSLISWEVP